MSFEAILKVVGWVIPLFIAMVFLSSFRLLSYILSAGCAIGTIVSVNVIRAGSEAAELMWIPVVLTLATVMLHGGDNYMNPNIVENAYRIVDVKRKWESIFADDDEYVIHIAPVEIGGFLENTVFCGIFCCLFYPFMIEYDNWLVLIPAMYFLGMSAVDVLLLLLHRVGIFDDFPTLIYWTAHIIVIGVVIVIGVTGGPSERDRSAPSYSAETEWIYEQCQTFAKPNYESSYRVSFDHHVPGNLFIPTQFMYDGALKIGGYYEEENEIITFSAIYANDPCLESAAKFNNIGRHVAEPELEFVELMQPSDNPFKYEPIQQLQNLSINKLCQFTKDKIEHAEKQTDTYEGTYTVHYKSADDRTYLGTIKYEVIFCFNLEGDTPGSLRYIECNAYDPLDDSYVYYFRYMPLEGETPLAFFVGEDGCLLHYEHEKKIDIFYDSIHNQAAQALKAVKDAVPQYDFQIKRLGNGSPWMYIYDAETEMTAGYSDETTSNYANGDYAATHNDFSTYKPDRLVSNPLMSVYNGDYTPIATASNPYFFIYYTYFDETTQTAIANALRAVFNFEREYAAIQQNGDVVITLPTVNNYLGGVDVACTLYMERTGEEEYGLKWARTTFTYEQYDYEFLLFTSDCFDIPAPTN